MKPHVPGGTQPFPSGVTVVAGQPSNGDGLSEAEWIETKDERLIELKLRGLSGEFKEEPMTCTEFFR